MSFIGGFTLQKQFLATSKANKTKQHTTTKVIIHTNRQDYIVGYVLLHFSIATNKQTLSWSHKQTDKITQSRICAPPLLLQQTNTQLVTQTDKITQSRICAPPL